MCAACIRKWLWIAMCIVCTLHYRVGPGLCTGDNSFLLENCGWDSAYKINPSPQTIITPSIDVSSNLECKTLIMPQSPYLSLKIVKFSLKGSGECTQKSERLSLEYSTNIGYKNITWCGQTYAVELNLPSTDVTLVYNSGAYGEGSGFEIQFSIVKSNIWNIPKLSAMAEPKLLYSPNYPGDYPESISTGVTILADNDQYIHIKSREISLEQDSSCQFDYLAINNMVYCGDSHIDVIVPYSSVEIWFTSDHAQQQSGFVLEYTSIGHQKFSFENSENVTVTASEYQSIIFINQTSSNSNKRCSLFVDSGSDDKVLAVKIPLLQIFSISFDQGQVLNSSFPASVQYFQSPGRNLTISLDDSLFQTTNTRTMWNLTIQAFDRGYLPTELPSESTLIWINQEMIRSQREHQMSSTQRLGFKVFDTDLYHNLTVSENILLFNGPDRSYFELTRDCRGKPRSERVIFSEGGPHFLTLLIRNTSKTGFWLYVAPPVPSQVMLKTEFSGNLLFQSFSLNSSLSVKNLFCRWEIQPSVLPVTIQARSNFNSLSNYSFVVKQVLSLDDQRSIAEAKYNQDTPVNTLMYSFNPVVITVAIMDLNPQYQLPKFTFSYSQDVYLIKLNSTYFASLKATDVKQAAQTPYYPNFYPSNIYYSWTIRNPFSSEKLRIVLNFPDLSNVLCSDTSVLNISTSSTFSQPTRICDKRSLTQYYEEDVVRVEFSSKVAVKPGFQFFFYHEVPPVYNCGSNITLLEGTASYLAYIQKPSEQYLDCYFYLYPISHDSSITLNVDLDFQYGNYLVVYSMEPPVTSSTKYSWQEVLNFNQQNNKIGNFTFKQSNLAIKAHFDYMPLKFKLGVLLFRDSCMNDKLEATAVEKFLASPRYPEPFPMSTACKWHITSNQGNIVLELADLLLDGLSYPCASDYLLIFEGPTQDQKLLKQYCAWDQFFTLTNEITVLFKPDQLFKTFGFRLKFYVRSTSPLTTTSYYLDEASASPSMILGSVIGCVIFAVLLVAAIILIIKKRRMNNRPPRREQSVYMNRRESTIFIVNPVIINNNMAPPPYPGLEPSSFLSNVPSVYASPPPYSEYSQIVDDPANHSLDLPPPYALNDHGVPENCQEIECCNLPESRGDHLNLGQESESSENDNNVVDPLPYEAEYAEITLDHSEQTHVDPPPAYNDVRADLWNVSTGRLFNRQIPDRGNSLGPL